mmetsp:Transcript_115374/g.327251  ORF Transcript_115374/g.327251 Transcript_115374/m.327251 type:complete len:198 (-) Transcript_115374:20-613(-)
MRGALAGALLLAVAARAALATRVRGRNVTRRAAAVLSEEARAELGRACGGACGAWADATCRPSCEVEMYGCLAEEAPRQEACRAGARAKYEAFQGRWNATHLLGRRAAGSEELRASVETECREACGPYADSSCAPRCEVEIYNCVFLGPDGYGMHDVDPERKAKIERMKSECKEEVLDKYRKFSAEWDENGPAGVPR